MLQEQLWQGGAWEQPQQAVTPLVLPPVKQKKRGGKKRGIIFAVFLLLIVVLTAAGLILSQINFESLLSGQPSAGSGSQNGTTQVQKTTIPAAGVGGKTRLELQPKGEQVLTVQEIYERCSPSVVFIQAYHKSGAVSTGSGVVMSADGYILTNAHVIAGASAARVVFQDNRTLEAGLVGYQSDYDLAVLKVKAKNLTPAQFGSSADLQVGDPVFAIGNPLGSTLRGTMTEGIVSAINRSVHTDTGTMSLIQTTAALNPGNSGGALINDRGQVVGITTMKMMSKYETIEGLGFAIPTRLAKRLADQIIATGRAETAVLGVMVVLDLTRYGGLRVTEVAEKSDAWAKGLRAGDVIVEVNGVPVTDSNALVTAREDLGVGDSLTLTVNRAGQKLEFSVMLVNEELLD